MSNNHKDTMMELQRQEVDMPEGESTYWPGHIALDASLLLAQMERGVPITQDSVDCIDIAIEKLERAKVVIAGRG